MMKDIEAGSKRAGMLIDSHVHLDMPQFSGDLDEVLARAEDAGIVEMLNVSYDEESMERTIELAEKYDAIYGACGIHPHDSGTFSLETDKAIKRCLLRKKIVAIGEIGLDYYRDLSPREVQRDIFRKQIGMALYFKKPIVIHSREAFDDVLMILEDEGAGEVGGIFHAFSGGEDELKRVLKLGFLIGIGGPITYKNSRLTEVIRRVPSDSFVLETDSPYLPPVPYRGKRNEPSYVAIVRDKVAEVLGVSQEDVERASYANYMRVIRRKRDFKPALSYGFKGNLYLNVTSSCTNNCRFCPRSTGRFFLYGYYLNLLVDPNVDELISAAKDELSRKSYKEIVFCGYGEPTIRLRDIVRIAEELKSYSLPIRLNTNGHGNMIHSRNIVPELEGVFDSVSVSMNATDSETYMSLCRPDFGEGAFEGVMDFIRKCAASSMKTTVTVLDVPGVDVGECERIVSGIQGAEFRVRRAYEYGDLID